MIVRGIERGSGCEKARCTVVLCCQVINIVQLISANSSIGVDWCGCRFPRQSRHKKTGCRCFKDFGKKWRIW